MMEIITHYNYDFQDITPPRRYHEYDITTYAGADITHGCDPNQLKNFTAGGYYWYHTSVPYTDTTPRSFISVNEGVFSIITRTETDSQGNAVVRTYYSTPDGDYLAGNNVEPCYVLRWQQLYTDHVQGQVVRCYIDSNGVLWSVRGGGHTATINIDISDVKRIAGIKYRPSTMYSVGETITKEAQTNG